MVFQSLRASLKGLTAYCDVRQLPVMERGIHLVDCICANRGEDALQAYTDLFFALRQEEKEGLGDWLWDTLRYRESPYAKLMERGGSDPALENAARRDVDTLIWLAKMDCDRYLSAIKPLLGEEFATVLASLPRWKAAAPFTFDTLTTYYQEVGSGVFARNRAFLWEEGKLIPVEDPDCPHPEELLGYELQRQQVVDNTRLMVEGHVANNVLLFGDGGTGKSATVKSMLYRPGMESLRLIEVQKENLTGMPQLIRDLAGRRQKFVLFIDDLAFDQDDKTYSSLKTILEGGLEKRPINVVIYATSNRRHLVRQTISDRAGDEVDTFETISEKTALAERFGLRIPYLTMNKREFLALVDHLAGLYHVDMDQELLHAKAMEWEIRHAGRTPRVAQQFIATLAG